MRTFCMDFYGVGVSLATDIEGLEKALYSTFSRRYLPRFRLREECDEYAARILWYSAREFRVLGKSIERRGPDIYIVEGPPPQAYVNESPVFFLLQVIARALNRKGLVTLTDTVALKIGERAHILMGFPHSGKSTISAIAVASGIPVIATENAVLRVGDRVEVVGGSEILVYDPEIKERYGLSLTPQERTKHGYEIIDLSAIFGPSPPVEVSRFYILHCSFSSTGVSHSPVKGRKVHKYLWYFATALLTGADYYEPAPLSDLLDEVAAASVKGLIECISRDYSDRFYEVFGSPKEAFEFIKSLG